MTTDDKNTEDQMSKDSNVSTGANETEGLADLGDISLEDDDELQLADDSVDDSNAGEEDLIELADVVDESSNDDGGLDAEGSEPISLDSEALEEEEIIDLVDAVDKDSESEEEIVELTDLFEEGDFQAEEEGFSGPSDDASAEETPDDSGLVQHVGVEMPAETSEAPVVEDTPLDLQEVSGDQEEADSGETIEQPVVYPEDGVSYEDASPPADESQDAALLETLSDDKIEAIITRVVRETVEEKADKILLEVAEAAVAREIEKIKKAL